MFVYVPKYKPSTRLFEVLSKSHPTEAGALRISTLIPPNPRQNKKKKNLKTKKLPRNPTTLPRLLRGIHELIPSFCLLTHVLSFFSPSKAQDQPPLPVAVPLPASLNAQDPLTPPFELLREIQVAMGSTKNCNQMQALHHLILSRLAPHPSNMLPAFTVTAA